jgi:hypothetical protein
MRSVSYRGALLVSLVLLSVSAHAAPRPVRTVKQIIRALGDFITVPTPAPTPPTKQQ